MDVWSFLAGFGFAFLLQAIGVTLMLWLWP